MSFFIYIKYDSNCIEQFEHHPKIFLISLLAISNRSPMLLCERKKVSDYPYLLHTVDHSQKPGKEQVLVYTLVSHPISVYANSPT